MGRAPCCDKMGVKKGPWSPEEDRKLIDYIQKNGFGNWRALPRQAGLLRCGKSCRLRWTNYLRPDLKRGSLSPEEEETIVRLHGILGNRWSTIASHLPGRTDNEIKNIWNTNLKKRFSLSGRSLNPVPTNSSSSTVPMIPLTVNNCLSKSLAMQYSHCFPGSPNSACNFSYSKDSAPHFTAGQTGLQYGTKYDKHGSETCSAHCQETYENRSAHDYINSLKKFLDIAEESSSEEHGSEDYDIAGVSDHIIQDYDRVISDYIKTEGFCSHSTLSGNPLDHEILLNSLADHNSQQYNSSSNSMHVYTPEFLAQDFLLDFDFDFPAQNPMDAADILTTPLWFE